MTIFNETFNALLKEAEFTKEMLGSGVTQIRNSNYALQGVYFQAFTSLSTGLERIGKLCLMLDYYIENQGRFPDAKYIKNVIGHNLLSIYKESKSIINKRSSSLRFLKNLDSNIHQNILEVLSSFAQGDRYSNINLLVGSTQRSDPIATWFEKVDQVILESYISTARKAKISQDARSINYMTGSFTSVLYTSENGSEITNIQDASYQTGVNKAVSPYRQLFVLQIIRYWVELLYDLQYKAMRIGKQDIPFFNELFEPFCNEDSDLKTQKSWDKI